MLPAADAHFARPPHTVMLASIVAFAVGICLALLGSGGSSLTVPALVFVVGQDDKTAIASSLAIVSAIAAVAAVPPVLSGRVRWRAVLLLGIPGALSTSLVAKLARGVSGTVQLIAFSLTIVIAGAMMLRSPTPSEEASIPRKPAFLVLDGLLVGSVTGFVGIGGGFLLVPVLHVLARLPLRTATGTSLAIISLNAAAGFVAYVSEASHQGIALDLGVIVVFIVAGCAGTVVGGSLSRRLNPVVIKRVFAIVLFGIGASILVARTR